MFREFSALTLLVVLSLLVSCAPSASPSSSAIQLPAGYQVRELAILPISGDVDGSLAAIALSAARAKSSAYEQLVTLVDVGSSSQSLNLEITVEDLSDSYSPIGLMTLANANVSASIFDTASGAIISSVTAKGDAMALGQDAPYYDALRSAVYNAVDAALREFAVSVSL